MILGLIVVVAVGAAAFVVLTSGDDEEKVVLEPIDLVQEDDFAGNLDVGDATAAATAAAASLSNTEVPDPRPADGEPGASLASHVVVGTDQAVYGGSRDTQVCDVANLLAFLTDEANSAKAEAWAGVLGIEVSAISDYVSRLTAVRLRFDTRVTNHGYRSGEANAFQSLLQAGTAVLVDDTGVPRVKCNCGNPLGEPTALGDGGGVGTVDDVAENPDEAWDGLDPAQAVSVEAGGAAVESVTLVDLDQGGLLERPVGSDGTSQTDVGTGDVQITLEWNSDSDLDLHIVEPDGTEIDYTNPGPTSTGGQLDVDSNIECDNDGGVENIFWPVGDAPSGNYQVSVVGYQLTREDGSDCGGGDFTLTIKVGGETTTETGTVGQDEAAPYDFSVP